MIAWIILSNCINTRYTENKYFTMYNYSNNKYLIYNKNIYIIIIKLIIIINYNYRNLNLIPTWNLSFFM